ncbi:MAG: hypothetical protein IH959_00230 [Chloroflexi bacterium]|nr:hypothetical protein [Chloroflexota bacterium]
MSPLTKTVIISLLALGAFGGAIAATTLMRNDDGQSQADEQQVLGATKPPPTTPLPTTTATATARLTEPSPTPTTEPNRADCGQIRGTPYTSAAERLWFLANCLAQDQPAPVQLTIGPSEAPTAAPEIPAVSDDERSPGEAAALAVAWWTSDAAPLGYSASAASCSAGLDGNQWVVRCQGELDGCGRQKLCGLTFTVCLIDEPRTIWSC